MSTSSLPLLLCDQLTRRCQPPYASNEAAIVEVMRALYTCDMTVELLQTTRVGVLLNSVKRHLSEEGAEIAKQLIAQWKETVRIANATPAAQPTSAIPAQSAASINHHSEPAVSQSSVSPTLSASDALKASSERRKRRAADISRSVSPPPLLRSAYAISDLPPSAYAKHALSPASAAAYHTDTAAHSLPTYNPNHHSHQPQTETATDGRSEEANDGDGRMEGETDRDDSGTVEGEVSVGDFDLTAKRRRQPNSDVVMAASYLPLPTSAVAVCSLQQMCVDYLAQPAVVNQLSALPPLPQPLLLAILQRASVDCLRRVQAGSGWMKEADLDELWKAAAVRRWGKQEVAQKDDERRTGRPHTASSWRAVYEKKEREKEDRLSEVGQRLKARVESERREKKERQAIKTMDVRQATKQLEKRGKKGKRQSTNSAVADGGVNGSSGNGISRSNSAGSSSSSNRLSALRKETGGLSQRFWSARPVD